MAIQRRGTFREDDTEMYRDQLVESQQQEITLLKKILDDQVVKITTKLRDAKHRITILEGLDRPQQPLFDEHKANILGLVKEVVDFTKEKADDEALGLQRSQSNLSQSYATSGLFDQAPPG